MTLVNARAAFETAINTAVTAADATVSVVFDNMPFTTPGRDKKYVLVTKLESLSFRRILMRFKKPFHSDYLIK